MAKEDWEKGKLLDFNSLIFRFILCFFLFCCFIAGRPSDENKEVIKGTTMK